MCHHQCSARARSWVNKPGVTGSTCTHTTHPTPGAACCACCKLALHHSCCAPPWEPQPLPQADGPPMEMRRAHRPHAAACTEPLTWRAAPVVGCCAAQGCWLLGPSHSLGALADRSAFSKGGGTCRPCCYSSVVRARGRVPGRRCPARSWLVWWADGCTRRLCVAGVVEQP